MLIKARKKPLRNLVVWASIGGMSFFPLFAISGAWDIAPSVSVSAEYDTNPKLLVSDYASIWRSKVTPGLAVGYSDGVSRTSLDAKLKVERSTDKVVVPDRNDPSVKAEWTRLLENGEFALSAGYDRSSTQVSEFQDSGVVTTDGSRNAATVGGKLLYKLGPEDSFSADVLYKDTRYQGGNSTDYVNSSLGFQYSSFLLARTQAFARLFAGTYVPDSSAASESLNYGASFGVTQEVFEDSFLTAQAGPSWIAIDGLERTQGWQGGVKLNYLLSRGDVGFELNRNVSPSSAGGFSESDLLRINASYQISEQTSAKLDLSWRERRADTNTVTKQARFSLDQKLFWDLSATAYWTYRQSEREQIGDARGNIVGVMLSYNKNLFD